MRQVMVIFSFRTYFTSAEFHSPTLVLEVYQSHSPPREQCTLCALVCSASSSSSSSNATAVPINLSRTFFIKCFSAEKIEIGSRHRGMSKQC